MPPQLPSAEEMARLTAQMATVLKQVKAAQRNLDAIVADFEAANDQLMGLAAEIVASESKLAALDAELRAAKAAINRRAASVYRSGRIELVTVLLSARTYRQFLSAFDLMKSVTNRDAKELGRIRALKDEAAKLREDLERRKAEQQALIADLAKRQKRMDASLAALGREYEKVRAEVEKRKSGFAFPVRAPYSYTDSYGAPRMEGTRYYHRHEGTDIFAIRGTAVLAVVDGVLEKVGSDTLGGIKLWLRSPGDNWTYYYAHLAGYAPGVANGRRVAKGEVLGFIGNTGNAIGTPSHLHFETHVPGGAPTNPHPILRRVDPLAK
jgi:murein DD-endopeptidase MepM/ murein hydrolase activator NlpD